MFKYILYILPPLNYKVHSSMLAYFLIKHLMSKSSSRHKKCTSCIRKIASVLTWFITFADPPTPHPPTVSSGYEFKQYSIFIVK